MAAVYTQQDRAFRLDTKLGGENTLLASFEGTESVSKPFRFSVRFLSEKPVDLSSLLGTDAVITVQEELSSTPVYFHGKIWSLQQCSATEQDMLAYEAELVPTLRLLALQRKCRIFHKATVRTIVSSIFESNSLKDYEFDLQGDLPMRDYCVQYRETDLNFVSRLLEEEGIFYFFQHKKDHHKLILTDKKAGLPRCPADAAANYHPLEGGARVSSPVFALKSRRRLRSGTVELTDYNYETPKISLAASLDNSSQGKLFQYPGRYATKSDGERYARIRLEEEEAQIAEVVGSGACAGFRAGHSFQLSGHAQRDWNRQYFVLSVHHSGENQTYRGDAQSQAAKYRNTFRAIPQTVQYRPPRITPAAIVHGTQTAIVIGPEGQEIDTDSYGRVQVRFFWAGAETNSCWVRVAQTWAGKNWGSIAIPRIGQEVVVEFLEGNPDRPLIIGSVYNADQMPPYDLPANKTRSGIRSHSTTGGAVSNCNEIYFEDRKGEEVLFFQAERDHQVNIKHDCTTTIGNDQTLTVKHNRDATVSNNDSLAVKADRSANITKNESLTVGADRTAKIAKNDSVQIGAKLSVVAGEEIKLSTPGGSITIGAEGITIQSPMTIVVQGAMVKIN
jgi:type VI secretion system secreted protein VgrG